MQNRVLIWGVGYIGFSNMIYYAKSGYTVTGVDIDSEKWDKICKGKELGELSDWISFDYSQLLCGDSVSFITDVTSLTITDVCVNLICIPTEINDEPWNDALFDVIDKIIALYGKSEIEQVPIVIESTLIPGTAEKVLNYLNEKLPNKQMYFCVAPRRDWFVKDEGSLKGLKNLPRVFGCNSYECTEYMKNIIGRVCDKLVVAENYIQAEMTKSVENAIRHVGITLANQLADAFPDTDIIKVLQLASSKWNVELYQPSLGIGGYCIPLSSKYLLKASPEKTLSVLQETVTYNKRREQDMIELLLKENASAICVFGICYVGNVKVIKNSMIVDFVRKCIANNLNIKVRDSMYSADEIKNIFQHDDLVAKNDEKFEMLVLFSAHKEYTDFFAEKICGMLYGKKIIWDNTGAWEKYRREFEQKGIQYKRIGSKGWKKI